MSLAIMRRALAIVAVALVPLVVPSLEARAVDILRLSEKTWDEAVPEGKEVDSIYGDWVLRNEHIVAVIADAVEGRNANMTVRNVGGSVIDLTSRKHSNDQLSAYYPVGTAYKLSGPTQGEDPSVSKAKQATLTFQGPSRDEKSKAEVIYELEDGSPWLKITTRITNTSNEPLELNRVDAMRADGEFAFGTDEQSREQTGLFFAYDAYWRQAYGIAFADPSTRLAVSKPGDRGSAELKLVSSDEKLLKLEPGKTQELVRYLYPAANTLDARALTAKLRDKPLVEWNLTVTDPKGLVDAAEVTVKTGDQVYAHGVTDAEGRLAAKLPAGEYQVLVSAQGRGELSSTLKLAKKDSTKVELPAPGYVAAQITDDDGKQIACKVQFTGRSGAQDPKFGPDSAVHGIRNLQYSNDGTFRTPLAPGEYDVIISHGPEYDAVFTTLTISGGKDSPLEAKLHRSVDTRGWISTDFHSHSTPSGDNTASQRGRVLNLLAEHIEFAPCTEHNRVTVYDPHLDFFKAWDRMLTCPGMELTGQPLPINHQNAFPLIVRARTQDGGGPKADVNPVVQIERLAMWDNGSEKLVQINHPNIPQMLGDKDMDGKADGGFEKMFSFMDVIEVHPLHTIFTKPDTPLDVRKADSAPIFHWMQLLNLGYRTPGVVNTDAHWNFHGSGWLRNYIKCTAEDPTKAVVGDLVHTCEHGNIVMSNGPYLEVSASADQDGDTADVGEDLSAPGGKLNVKIRVQCPNWLVVNRVQIFVNGVPTESENFTRRTHSAMFHDATVVFDQTVPLKLERDAHLIVACIGEDQGLGTVMGPDHARDVPCAVGNPIFVDIDGNGFKPNGDLLGIPLVMDPDGKPSKPHQHRHD